MGIIGNYVMWTLPRIGDHIQGTFGRQLWVGLDPLLVGFLRQALSELQRH